MQPDEIYDDFLEHLAKLNLQQRLISEAAKRELKHFEESINYNASNAFGYRTPQNGELIKYKSKKTTLNERINIILLQKNKQYCWLLVDAYETFVIYLKSAYAYAGFKDKSQWPLNDFGNKTLKNLYKEKYDFFLKQANNKKGGAKSIRDQFKILYSELNDIEINNALGVNLNIAITTIEHLRHIIVHKKGQVDNRERFEQKIAKKINFNGKNKLQQVSEFTEQFIGTGEYLNQIIILEQKISSIESLNTYIDTYEKLAGYLIAYASVINKNLKKL